MYISAAERVGSAEYERFRPLIKSSWREATAERWGRKDLPWLVSDFDVIRAPTLPGTRDYHWILCLPLLMHPAGKSIGVIGFAATQDDTQLARELSELAYGIASRANEHERRTVALWHVLNIGFWHALASVAKEVPSLLSRSVSEMADQCLQSSLPPPQAS